MVGNVCLWNPSTEAAYSSFLVYKIFAEAGIPPGVIQFVPGDDPDTLSKVLSNRDLAALHFSGSLKDFQDMWKQIGANVLTYKNFPRIVGGAGGNNFHIIHPGADEDNAVCQTVLSAVDYQGQKYSSCSRLYVPQSWWGADASFRKKLVDAVDKINADFPQKDGRVKLPTALWKAGFTEEITFNEKVTFTTGINSRGRIEFKKEILIKEVVTVVLNPDMLGPVKYARSYNFSAGHLTDSSASSVEGVRSGRSRMS